MLVNATYSVRGFGVSAGAHSFDNMFYQSDRSSPTPFDLNINFLPPLTKQHTYNLPATLYPYATQPNGEVSGQGEVFYKWKKGSKLGGKYGTKIAVNYSVAYALDTVELGIVDDTTQRLGYTSQVLRARGPALFPGLQRGNAQECKHELGTRPHLPQHHLRHRYDPRQSPGTRSCTRTSSSSKAYTTSTTRTSLRFELQHLSTKQDQGNWATALAEFTFSPHWFVAAMDQFNYVTFDDTFLQDGKTEVKPKRIHYPIGSCRLYPWWHTFPDELWPPTCRYLLCGWCLPNRARVERPFLVHHHNVLTHGERNDQDDSPLLLVVGHGQLRLCG